MALEFIKIAFQVASKPKGTDGATRTEIDVIKLPEVVVVSSGRNGCSISSRGGIKLSCEEGHSAVEVGSSEHRTRGRGSGARVQTRRDNHRDRGSWS